MIKRVAIAVSLTTSIASAVPTDPYFPQQWYLHNDGKQEILIDVDRFHTIRQKGVAGADIGWLESRDQVVQLATAPVTVAVIDSGLDANHPELAGRISGDGFNFLKDNPQGTPAVFDDMGHGTHVAGIIAANADNKAGIAGVAPASVKVLPLRVLSKNFRNFSFVGKLISDYAADAVNYAVAHGATVINMSFGWPKIVDTETARRAVQNAIQKGVLIVAASGNDRKNEPTYPCDYPGVLCVGSVTNTGQMATFSNTGGIVDLLAPGDGILSLYPLKVESSILRIQGYELLKGTSQSAPQVAAVAATLRSAFPAISLNELKARLLSSASAPPVPDAALFGAVNLKRALKAEPQAVFLPEFKGIDAVSVDEDTLETSGQLSLANLWKPTEQVQVEVSINGKSSGAASVETLASGERISVPWKFKFGSLDESSRLRFNVRISDASGKSQTFPLDVPAVRAIDKVREREILRLPPSNWIGSTFGHLFSRFTQVPDYPAGPRLPGYYQLLGSNEQGSTIQFFDPTAATPVKTVSIPGITVISRVLPQVLRIDADRDGKLDWVVAGLARDKKDLYFQFYFLNSEFQPLWGSADAATWRVPVDMRFAQILVRNYATPGSWIKSGDRLLPAFMDVGVLPDPDNYRPLSSLHFKSDTHLYYLAPQKKADTAVQGPVQLEIRALDSKEFRDKNRRVRVLNVVPANAHEQAEGHIRLLLGAGDTLDSTTSMLDVRSITDFSVSSAPEWDSFTSNGQPVSVLGMDSRTGSAGFLNFFDEARGSLAWTGANGALTDQTEFGFKSIDNAIQGLMGAIDLGASGRFLFLESRFDIVAVQLKQGAEAGNPRTLPIERDSSFPGQAFSEMFNPVVVGTAQRPMPGVYIDSTLVRGNQVSVAVVDPASGDFFKPLRYSLQVPGTCVQMAPIHLTDGPDSFALPLFCQSGTQTEYRVVRPR